MTRFEFSMSNKDLIGDNANLQKGFRNVIINDNEAEDDDRKISIEMEIRDNKLVFCQTDSNDLEMVIEY